MSIDTGTAKDHRADVEPARQPASQAPPQAAAGQPAADPAEELVGRLFSAAVGALDLYTIHLGVELGLYRALAEHGPQDAATLAARTGLAERYVREWLQGQVTTGLAVPVDSAAGGPKGSGETRERVDLAPGVSDVLLDPLAPTHVAPVPAAIAAIGTVLPRLADAYRSGQGVPYAEYPDAYSIQAAFNRPAFTHDLVGTWLPAMPEVMARLSDPTRSVHIGDLGCGAGWSSIALARAFPQVTVEGIDNDARSIELARANAAESGIADRVTFTVADLGVPDEGGAPRYDVAFFFECLHDLPRPVAALTHARLRLRADGVLIVMEERAAESLAAPGDELERFLAQISTLWCLPQGLVGPDPGPVGTLLRPAMMRDLAARAGFADVAVLDIEHPTWRFYQLHP